MVIDSQLTYKYHWQEHASFLENYKDTYNGANLNISHPIKGQLTRSYCLCLLYVYCTFEIRNNLILSIIIENG